MFDVPIAFVFFNRPEPTQRSFDRIRAAQPSQLFLISDAPRAGHAEDVVRVRECRRIVESVDWTCEVQTLYASENMGCGRRISSAITAIMQQTERLIILEDDCVANATFFRFCDELLERYATDQRVMAISGDNFQYGTSRTDASYYFSKYPHCWGWATWKRAWEKFQLDIPAWPEFRDAGYLAAICSSQRELRYWTRIFDHVYEGKSSSWAYPWTLCCWMHHGLTALPSVNLVSNQGFGEDATHTKQQNSVTNLPTQEMESIIHPELVNRHFVADQFTDDTIFSGDNRRSSPLRRLRHAIQSRRAA